MVTEIDGIKYDLWGSADGALDEKSVGFVGAAVEGQDGWWSLTAGGTIGILNENYTSTFPPTTTPYDQFFVESVIFMPFNPFMSGIENINADNNAPVEYFNLQGIRVSNRRTAYLSAARATLHRKYSSNKESHYIKHYKGFPRRRKALVV